MEKANVDIGEAYYTAMGAKNAEKASSYLHPDIEFIGPLGNMRGKSAVLESIKRFVDLFETLTIRAKFEAEDQAMLALDFDCPPPIGVFSGASLLTFKEGLIAKIELFYDARPFEQKKAEIFS